MIIHYLWIKKYGILNEVGIDLSNKFDISYDEKNYKLLIKDSKFYIPGFFGNPIESVTGLIGENGAGKTTVIRFILQYCVSGFGTEDPEAIFVMEQGNTLYLYHHPTIQVKVISKLKYSRSQSFSSLTSSFIYHSNHFEPFTDFEDLTKNEYAGLGNLSTSYRLINDYSSRFNNDRNYNTPFDDVINAHSIEELHRQVSLFRKYTSKDLLIRIPSYIVVSLNNIDEEQIAEDYENLVKYFNNVKKYFANEDHQSQFLFEMLRASIFNLINNHIRLTYSSQVTEFSTIVEDALLEIINAEFINYAPSLLDNFIDVIKSKIQSSKMAQELITFMSNFFNQYIELIFVTRSLLKPKNVTQDKFYVNIRTQKRTQIDQFLDIYSKTERITRILDLRFSHDRWLKSRYSSGEYYILSIFARLMWWVNKNKKGAKGSSIILILDEAEIGFHPKWQLQFLQVCINFINQEFKNFRIQLILTSHSPFFLSDLPPNCMVLLKKEGDNISSIKSLESHPSSFGANIHKLFQDSFFLDSGLIGNFAKSKIDELIIEISESEDLTDNLKKRINMIGEPFIRNKLMDMISDEYRNSRFEEKTLDTDVED